MMCSDGQEEIPIGVAVDHPGIPLAVRIYERDWLFQGLPAALDDAVGELRTRHAAAETGGGVAIRDVCDELQSQLPSVHNLQFKNEKEWVSVHDSIFHRKNKLRPQVTLSEKCPSNIQPWIAMIFKAVSYQKGLKKMKKKVCTLCRTCCDGISFFIAFFTIILVDNISSSMRGNTPLRTCASQSKDEQRLYHQFSRADQRLNKKFP